MVESRAWNDNTCKLRRGCSAASGCQYVGCETQKNAYLSRRGVALFNVLVTLDDVVAQVRIATSLLGVIISSFNSSDIYDCRSHSGRTSMSTTES